MTMQSDDLLGVMMPGMREAADAWMASYYDLYVNRGPATNPGEKHARHLEEAGLLGRAFAIMQQIQNSRRDTRPAPSFQRLPLEREALTSTGPYDPFRPPAGASAGDDNGAATHP